MQFSNSLTKGTISAINRTISSSSAVKYIQTDAAINPGNSGGALINSYSQIIGINTSKLVSEEYEGMGFAIPSNTVISIVNNIIRMAMSRAELTLALLHQNGQPMLLRKMILQLVSKSNLYQKKMLFQVLMFR